jgi:hypothetical protein
MPTATTLNGPPFVSLEEALASADPSPPPLSSEFSVLLVGVLRSDGEDGDAASVRLYPADGRDDEYYLIKRMDVDQERVEVLSPEMVAARGWIAEKVVRLRVRASAELFAIQSRAVEARQLGGCGCGAAATSDPCLGNHCAAPFVCVPGVGGRVCRNPQNGQTFPCPSCQ